MDPRIPSLAYGTTICQVLSQRVAPKASAASLCSRGTAKRASRDTEMMKGMVMIDRTIPPVRSPKP